MLDQVYQFVKESHVLGIGIGLLAIVFAAIVLLRDPTGRWRWDKSDKDRRH